MDWRIVVKNKYPAYISWETFEKVKAMLRDNRAEYLRTKNRGTHRDRGNRLVGSELEHRWETALSELRRAEAALARRALPVPPQSVGVDPHLRAKVVALGERLPAIWSAPSTRRAHRNALLRCLIEKVVMRRSARDKAEVRIVWRGGATPDLIVMMPVNSR